VNELVRFLKKEELTLLNYASISDQQVGGLVQAGVHGTGANIPPMDEHVVSMKLITPSKGTIELSREKNSELFHATQVGLGAFGILSEVTLQCTDWHLLEEKVVVMTRQEIKNNHRRLLQDNKHLKYLWIPYTNDVVVITCNISTQDNSLEKNQLSTYSLDEKLKSARDLLLTLKPNLKPESYKNHSFTDLRDDLLEIDPINVEYVKKINQAEAQFWRLSQENRTLSSDSILLFQCGGQQWVNEVAFPCGTLVEPNLNDIEYSERLLQIIEENNIPAPSPIEQRWTSRSTGLLSPAYSPHPEELFTWIGIIMYLPLHDQQKRDLVTQVFRKYRKLCRELWDKYRIKEHWAKLEFPEEETEKQILYQRIRGSYPLSYFISLRKELDPKEILANPFISYIFSEHD